MRTLNPVSTNFSRVGTANCGVPQKTRFSDRAMGLKDQQKFDRNHYTGANADRQEWLTMLDERSFPGFRIRQVHAEFHAVTALAFGLIHGGIGDRHQKLWIAIGSAKSNSDTHSQRHVVVP